MATSNTFTAVLTATLENLKFNLSGPASTVNLSPDGFTLTLTGTRSEINSLLPEITFIATDNGINAAKILESKEEVGTIEIININISAVRNDKIYYKTGTVEFTLDSYKHSTFTISGKNVAFVQQINDLTWDKFQYAGTNYIYANTLITDAEKQLPSTNNPDYDDPSDLGTMDDNLCWAASSANMLEFTGWGRKELGLSANQIDREDKIFRYFVERTKKDQGYNQQLGIMWFSTGYYMNIGGWEYTSGGNVLNGFNLMTTPDQKLRFYKCPGTSVIQLFYTLKVFLKNGCGVGLGVTDSSGSLGHALTCIGISYNTSYAETSSSHYTGLFIVDSDDHKKLPTNQQQDIVTYCPITYNSSLKNYIINIYSGYGYGNVYIDGITILGRNNNYYDWFFNYGELKNTSTDESLRYLAKTDDVILNTNNTYSNQIYDRN